MFDLVLRSESIEWYRWLYYIVLETLIQIVATHKHINYVVWQPGINEPKM